jgi:hypothetical protein
MLLALGFLLLMEMLMGPMTKSPFETDPAGSIGAARNDPGNAGNEAGSIDIPGTEEWE